MCERFLFASNDTIKSNGRGRVLKLSINYLIGLKAKWVSKVYRGITQTTKKKKSYASLLQVYKHKLSHISRIYLD